MLCLSWEELHHRERSIQIAALSGSWPALLRSVGCIRWGILSSSGLCLREMASGRMDYICYLYCCVLFVPLQLTKCPIHYGPIPQFSMNDWWDCRTNRQYIVSIYYTNMALRWVPYHFLLHSEKWYCMRRLSKCLVQYHFFHQSAIFV